jgi:hypothetical protein
MTDFFTEPTPVSTIVGAVSVVTDGQSGQKGNLTVANDTTVSHNLTVANLTTLGGLAGGILGAGSLTNAATVTAGGTIAAPGSGIRIVRIQAGSASTTSCALATGAIDGQDLILINPGATAITISTNVSAATTLAASGAVSFNWDAGLALWCHKV